jgi:flavin-dependent dehydrogenase
MVNSAALPAFTDVFIVGGGPAGLGAALAARRLGFDVTVADACLPPIDKPCGEGLMPDGVAALFGLGVDLSSSHARPFPGIRFVGPNASVQARFRHGVGRAIRRTVLHRTMAERAAQAGVRLCWRTPVRGISPAGVRVGDSVIPSRWIIGADGANSQVRKWAGLESLPARDRRFAFRRHYQVRNWPDFMELHWGPRCQLYITPVSPTEICIALISRDPHLRLDAALRHFPQLSTRLLAAVPSSAERGAITVTMRLPRVYRGNVVLLGDASGGVDAITGEGLCLAFQQAPVLAAALAADDLASYQSFHRRLARRPQVMARLMLLLESSPRLRDRVLRIFMESPAIFERMLATHIGAATPRDLLANTAALGWGLLRGAVA